MRTPSKSRDSDNNYGSFEVCKDDIILKVVLQESIYSNSQAVKNCDLVKGAKAL